MLRFFSLAVTSDVYKFLIHWVSGIELLDLVDLQKIDL